MKNLLIRAKDLRQKETRQEEILWRQLRNRACSNLKFKRQQTIDGYIVDFCCPEGRLVIEIDGPVQDDANQMTYDRDRDHHLASQGFSVLKVANHEIENALPKVLEKIRLSLAAVAETPQG